MSEIPEDTMRTARTVLPPGRSSDLMVWDREVLDRRIARAILAERERCARIAEGWKATMQNGQFIDEAFRNVAAAIRFPSPAYEGVKR